MKIPLAVGRIPFISLNRWMCCCFFYFVNRVTLLSAVDIKVLRIHLGHRYIYHSVKRNYIVLNQGHVIWRWVLTDGWFEIYLTQMYQIASTWINGCKLRKNNSSNKPEWHSATNFYVSNKDIVKFTLLNSSRYNRFWGISKAERNALGELKESIFLHYGL